MEDNVIQLFYMLVGLVVWLFMDSFCYRRYSRKCSYDCEKCRYRNCPASYCNEKRKECEENTRHD